MRSNDNMGFKSGSWSIYSSYRIVSGRTPCDLSYHYNLLNNCHGNGYIFGCPVMSNTFRYLSSSLFVFLETYLTTTDKYSIDEEDPIAVVVLISVCMTVNPETIAI